MFGEQQRRRSPARGLRQHGPCLRLGTRSQYPWDLVRLGIEASLRTPPAARSTSLNACALPGLVEVRRTATRESLGTISFKRSSCLPLISGARLDNPVMFPPGRARLATNPLPTGSVSNDMTMGIVEVASLAARVTVGPVVTMTSTLRRTSSAASVGRRSGFSSACRYSMTMFLPSSYPSSRRPCRNASVRAATAEGEVVFRYPIRGIFVGCCASAIPTHPISVAMITVSLNISFRSSPIISSLRW